MTKAKTTRRKLSPSETALIESAKRGGVIVCDSTFSVVGVQHTEHSIRGTVALAQACEANARALLEIARTMNGSNVTTGPALTIGAKP